MTNAADPHAGQPVLHLGPKPDAARLTAILVHGRGASADDILEPEPGIPDDGRRLSRAAGRRAQLVPVVLPRADSAERAVADVRARRVASLITSLSEQGVPADRVAILGFSQGACLTLEFAARNPRRYAAVIGLSGGLIGPPGTPRVYPGSLDGTPVFLGCSDVDAHIPVDRVRESAAVLRTMKAVVDERIYRGMGHTVNSDEVAAVRNCLLTERVHARDRGASSTSKQQRASTAT